MENKEAEILKEFSEMINSFTDEEILNQLEEGRTLANEYDKCIEKLNSPEIKNHKKI